MDVKKGDRIAVESEHVGDNRREGSVLEVIGSGDATHYRVRWNDGHESLLFPSAGSVTIVGKVGAAG